MTTEALVLVAYREQTKLSGNEEGLERLKAAGKKKTKYQMDLTRRIYSLEFARPKQGCYFWKAFIHRFAVIQKLLDTDQKEQACHY